VVCRPYAGSKTAVSAGVCFTQIAKRGRIGEELVRSCFSRNMVAPMFFAAAYLPDSAA